MTMRALRPLLAAGVVAGLCLLAVPARAGAPAGRYTVDSASGTVVDNETGLMWQRDVPAFNGPWLSALGYCEALTAGGYSDWRLPSVKELRTIVDVGTVSPAIDLGAFPGTPSEFFWASTPWAGFLGTELGVNFSVGCTAADSTGGYGRVRCVR